MANFVAEWTNEQMMNGEKEIERHTTICTN